MPRSDLKMPQSQLLSFCRLLLLNKHSHHAFVSSKQVLVNSRSLFLTSSPISSAWCQIGLSPFSVIYHSGASYSSQHQEGDAVWSCFANYLVLPPLSTGSPGLGPVALSPGLCCCPGIHPCSAISFLRQHPSPYHLHCTPFVLQSTWSTLPFKKKKKTIWINLHFKDSKIFIECLPSGRNSWVPKETKQSFPFGFCGRGTHIIIWPDTAGSPSATGGGEAQSRESWLFGVQWRLGRK